MPLIVDGAGVWVCCAVPARCVWSGESREKRPKEEEVGCDFYLVEESRRYLSHARVCMYVYMCVCQ